MGMMQISFTVAGEQQLDATIQKVLFMPQDMSPAFREIAADFYASMARRFASEGAVYGGTRWKSLSPAYAAWKLGIEVSGLSRREQNLFKRIVVGGAASKSGRRLGKTFTRLRNGRVFIGGVAPGAPILSLRGAASYRGPGSKSPNLRESFIAGKPGNVTVIEPQEMAVGTELKVGRWNLGLLHQMGTKRMPARPPITLDNAQKLRWRNIIRQYLIDQFAILRRERPTS